MKKTSLFLSLALMLSLISSSFAFAETNFRTSVNSQLKITNGEDSANTSEEIDADGDLNSRHKDRGERDEVSGHNSSTTTVRNEDKNDNDVETQGEESADMHRSVVASFVQHLLNIADHDKGIGAKVRVIAEDQDHSSSSTVAAMSHLEGQGRLHVFFFGTDETSLSLLRAAVANTTVTINQLRALAASSTDVAIKAELNTQIQVLVREQASLQAFIDAHASGVSLFGWFFKIFRR